MNWGKSIFLFYSLFVLALLTVVYFSFTQDVNLVAEDYYQQEIVYEDQIIRIKNTEGLKNKPSVVLKNNYLELSFPLELKPKGTILLYRPSDASKDRRIAIALGASGTQQIDFSTQDAGLWKAKLNWKQGDIEYFQEFIIVK
jgi:hypothetical protein